MSAVHFDQLIVRPNAAVNRGVTSKPLGLCTLWA